MFRILIFTILFCFYGAAYSGLPTISCNRGGGCFACDEFANCIQYIDHGMDFRNGCHAPFDPKAPYLECKQGVCSICENTKCLNLDFRTKEKVRGKSALQDVCSKLKPEPGIYKISADHTEQSCTALRSTFDYPQISLIDEACVQDLRTKIKLGGSAGVLEYICSVKNLEPIQDSDSRVSNCK